MIQGRWTITREGEWDIVNGPECSAVPVVPCDDAAIERVAAELCRQRGWDWPNAGDEVQTALRNAAALALVAAGETP